MDIRKQFIVFISLLFCAQSLAQNFTVSPTSEQSRYEGERNIQEEESQEEENDIETFTAEPDWHQQLETNEITSIEEVTSSRVISNIYLQTTYSGSDLDEHALRVSANCQPLKSDGKKGAAVVALDDSFYVIPVTSGDLPPYPPGGGKAGLHGVDVNKNCVRDDIEHYVFNLYGAEDQQQLRLYLYEYAIWLNFFLNDNISHKTVRTVARQSVKVGTCLAKYTSDSEAKTARDGLFAYSHNTDERTQQFFTNMEALSGFLLEGDIGSTC